MKGVVGPFEEMKCRARPEFFAHWTKQIEVSELVASALKKKHRNADTFEMLATFGARATGRMQRKPKKDQPAHAFERFLGGGEGAHPPAHRLAASKQDQIARSLRPSGHSGPHRGSKDRLRVRDPSPVLHVGELITERCDAKLGQLT